ncbi:MAG: hypothetical protein AB7O28_11640 [Vicinamibacterales bacterium]
MTEFPRHVDGSAVRAITILLLVAAAGQASAQTPDVASGRGESGRVSVGGEVSATYGSLDPGFFNYATYAYDPLRNVRVVLDASVRVAPHVELLGEVRTDGASEARVSALYVRVRPWLTRGVDVQAGRVPTAFGLYGRRSYGGDTPFVTRPLPYAYLLSLRPDALPATADDLLEMRGRGWLSAFPRGVTAPDRGLPIVNTDTWDTGVQVRLAGRGVQWAASVTRGTIGRPRLDDDNGGRSLSTRAVWRPHPGVALGASAADGAYLSRAVRDTLSAGERLEQFHQRAAGVDVDLSYGRWLLRSEVLWSRWNLPAFDDEADGRSVGAMASWAEARVRLIPGLDVGLRAERLGFDRIATASGQAPWEAAVSRLESGLAFVPVRHVRVTLDVQRNRRPLGGRVRHDTLLAGQVAVWF